MRTLRTFPTPVSVLVGSHSIDPVVSFADVTLGNLQSYRYTATSMQEMSFVKVHSVPAFIGTFVVGKCVSTTDSAHLMFGWVRSYTGVMVATSVRPANSDVLLSGNNVAPAMAADESQLDMLRAAEK